MRVCIVYDCLYPYTIGGAERWYRNLAERLRPAATRSPTSPGGSGRAARSRSSPASRRGRLPAHGALRERRTARLSRRSLFGLGVFGHLLRHGGATTSCTPRRFPTSRSWRRAHARRRRRVPALRRLARGLDAGYWREYLGPLGGRDRLARAARLPARPAARVLLLAAPRAAASRAGLAGELTRLEGQYAGPARAGGAGAGAAGRRLRRPAHPGKASPGARAGSRPCARADSGAQRRDLR